MPSMVANTKGTGWYVWRCFVSMLCLGILFLLSHLSFTYLVFLFFLFMECVCVHVWTYICVSRAFLCCFAFALSFALISCGFFLLLLFFKLACLFSKGREAWSCIGGEDMGRDQGEETIIRI